MIPHRWCVNTVHDDVLVYDFRLDPRGTKCIMHQAPAPSYTSTVDVIDRIRDGNSPTPFSMSESGAMHGSIDWLIDWCFNGTLTQKGQIVPTAGERNRLSRLRMANVIQCIIPYVTR